MPTSRHKVTAFLVITVASCGGVLASPSGIDGGPPDDAGMPGASGSSNTGATGPTTVGSSSSTTSSSTGYAGGYTGSAGYAGSGGRGSAGYAGGFGGSGYGGSGYGGAGYAGYAGRGYGGSGYAGSGGRGYGGKAGYAGGYGGYGGGTGYGGYGGAGYAGKAGYGGFAGGYAGSAGRPIPPSRCYGFIADPVEVTFPVISRFESDAGATVEAVAPGGFWTATGDGTGTTSMRVEPCGTNGQGMHFVGRNHVVWGADLTAEFMGVQHPVDASRYSGVSFVIKSATSTSVIVKLQNLDSDPWCGRCDDAVLGGECYAGYIKTVSVASNDTSPVSFRWSDFAATTWGYHWPGQVTADPKELVSMTFAFDTHVDFDVCIDDIVFTF